LFLFFDPLKYTGLYFLGSDFIFYPGVCSAEYISKQVPVCQKWLKQMLMPLVNVINGFGHWL